MVIGMVVGLFVMGRSLVRGMQGRQDGGEDFCLWASRTRRFYTSRMGKFRLRVAKSEDVAGIRGLIDASVRGLQAGDYSAAQIEGALATVFTVDSRLIADGTYFVAFEEGGQLVGCGGWSFRRTLYGGDHQVETIEPARLDPEVDAAKIRAIFVHPKFARMGLGSLILAAAEEAAIERGFRRFEMGSTLTGVALYSLEGYREVGRIAVPVGNGERIEVVRMVKEC
jgi:GNAT superfamily N-acetyltransferase